jgi:hypothetical protein
MKRLLILMLTLPMVANAQWQIGGNLGLRTRPDGGDGKSVLGVQLEGMLVKPAGQWTHLLQGAIVQMKNHNAAGQNIRENSLEGSYLLRRALGDRFGIAAGPVLGYSLGCASGGKNATTYGDTPCVASFADDGTVRPGYALQLDAEWKSARGVTWRAGVRAVGRTMASGSKTPKPVVWGGLSAPLNSR